MTPYFLPLLFLAVLSALPALESFAHKWIITDINEYEDEETVLDTHANRQWHKYLSALATMGYAFISVCFGNWLILIYLWSARWVSNQLLLNKLRGLGLDYSPNKDGTIDALTQDWWGVILKLVVLTSIIVLFLISEAEPNSFLKIFTHEGLHSGIFRFKR